MIKPALPVALALLWASSHCVAAPRHDAAWTMALAVLKEPSLAFSGRQKTVLYLGGKTTVEAHVAVYSDGKGGIRREYISGPARGTALLQRGGTTWQRTPAGRWLRLPAVPHLDPSAAVSLVTAGYQVMMASAEPILGRFTVIVAMRPRRQYCPSRIAWLQPTLGIVLRDEMRAPGGALRSSTEYTSLTVGPPAAVLFMPPPGALPGGPMGPASVSARRSAAEAERETGRRVWLPSYVPAGFRLVGFGVTTGRAGRLLPVVRYSDGLAAFTIFERGPYTHVGSGGGPGMEAMVVPPVGGGAFENEGLQASVAARPGRRANYVVVGDITVDQLARVAASLP